jgi:hypothetical protein
MLHARPRIRKKLSLQGCRSLSRNPKSHYRISISIRVTRRKTLCPAGLAKKRYTKPPKKRPYRRFTVSMYCAISDGTQRVYTDQQCIAGYDSSLSLKSTPLYNVFVNGMLQPPMNYTLEKGRLCFNTTDLPPKNTPITIQFIRFGRRKKGGDHMPIIKPVYTATASTPVASGGTITTTINPVSSGFLATLTAGMIGATETTIPAASFTTDSGDPVVALPDVTADDYYDVYVNGTLQQSTLSTLTTASLVLDTVDVTAGIPIYLSVVSFAGSTSVQTTPPDITAPTITIFT